MEREYGVDDTTWLLETATAAGTVDVPTATSLLAVPAARLDNRDDLTSHLRGDPDAWDPALRVELDGRLRTALRALGL
jgi:hypothetical protein